MRRIATNAALDQLRSVRHRGWRRADDTLPSSLSGDEGSKGRSGDHRNRQAHRVPAEHVSQGGDGKGEVAARSGLPTLPKCSSRICALSTCRSTSDAPTRKRTASHTRLWDRSRCPTVAASSFVRFGNRAPNRTISKRR
jgi:hypothetical protein